MTVDATRGVDSPGAWPMLVHHRRDQRRWGPAWACSPAVNGGESCLVRARSIVAGQGEGLTRGSFVKPRRRVLLPPGDPREHYRIIGLTHDVTR
jgi:hypothetical protein